MIYGDICTGISAASVAFKPLGWRSSWFAEIEAFPSAALAHHYPDVPNLGDMTKIAVKVLTGAVPAPDLMVGGTPCQAFSVAGMREGLADARGQLTIKYVELADAIDFIRVRNGKPPAIFVWENVPGVLSSKDNAFGCFLAGLAGEDCELKPPGGKWKDAGFVSGPKRTIAWRVLDAQYFGLAQRRRRVFVIASSRKGFDPAAVLFESDGVRRDSAPSRETGKAVAALIANGVGTCGADDNQAQAGHILAFGGGNTSGSIEVAACLTAKGQRVDFEVETFAVQCVTGDITHTLKADGFDASEDGTGRGQPIVPVLPFDTTQVTSKANVSNPQYGDPCHPLTATSHVPAIAYRTAGDGAVYTEGDCIAPLTTGTDPSAQIIAFGHKDHGADATGDLAPTMRAMGNKESHANSGGSIAVAYSGSAELQNMAVRRLTPRECERLQGFPDSYTDVPYRKKPAADGPRYKALGNSMAVPCMRWIGERIQAVINAI